MSGIVTLTLAPAIDRTYRVDRVRVDAVHRASSVHTELSGKGVNVAQAAALGGGTVRAVVPLGPAASAELRAPLAHVLAPVEVAEGPRVNTSIIADDGTTTKVNEAATALTTEQWDALRDATVRAVAEIDADWLVIAGSIPTVGDGGERAPFVSLAQELSQAGCRVALDTAGAALTDAVAAASAFALLKPNTRELAAEVGRALTTIGEVTAAAREVIATGCPLLYVSMGADGALAVTAAEVWWARATVAPVNSAGAGDASLAGFLVGHERSLADATRTAAEWGALAVASSGTLLTSLHGLPTADLQENPDPTQALSEPARPDEAV